MQRCTATRTIPCSTLDIAPWIHDMFSSYTFSCWHWEIHQRMGYLQHTSTMMPRVQHQRNVKLMQCNGAKWWNIIVPQSTFKESPSERRLYYTVQSKHISTANMYPFANIMQRRLYVLPHSRSLEVSKDKIVSSDYCSTSVHIMQRLVVDMTSKHFSTWYSPRELPFANCELLKTQTSKCWVFLGFLNKMGFSWKKKCRLNAMREFAFCDQFWILCITIECNKPIWIIHEHLRPIVSQGL